MPNAIISVYDKTKLDYLGESLNHLGFNIYATTGTLKYLHDQKIRAFPVENIASNPTGFDSFITSLSFNTLIGTLVNEKTSVDSVKIEKIDVVVYNFVRTWEVIKTLDDFNISHVDLGGPTMIRAAAINFKYTLPIVSPSQYDIVEDFPHIEDKKRLELAREVFEYCAWYDNKLSEFLHTVQRGDNIND